MPYSGLLPCIEAIKQACKEPLDLAPRDQKGFAVYIFDRAREIEHGWALARTISQQSGQQKMAALDGVRQSG